jgi:hypothetical protein
VELVGSHGMWKRPRPHDYVISRVKPGKPLYPLPQAVRRCSDGGAHAANVFQEEQKKAAQPPAKAAPAKAVEAKKPVPKKVEPTKAVAAVEAKKPVPKKVEPTKAVAAPKKAAKKVEKKDSATGMPTHPCPGGTVERGELSDRATFQGARTTLNGLSHRLLSWSGSERRAREIQPDGLSIVSNGCSLLRFTTGALRSMEWSNAPSQPSS